MSDVDPHTLMTASGAPSGQKPIWHQRLADRFGALLPGVALSLVLAAFSIWVAGQFGGPVMVFALLFGFACSPLQRRQELAPGVDFSAKQILRIGVALLGVRITVSEIASLGLPTVALVVSGVAFTLLTGWLIGRALGLRSEHALLSAGSVAICGASAALAISAVLPRNEKSECKTIMTVVGVTALSTIAMVLYPVITRLIGFDHTLAGIFLGATIHDVAQVVGAGYMISDEAGDVATIVKLMRVTCLVPVVILIGLLFRNETGSQNCESSPPLIPAFLIGFVLLVGLNSSGVIPPDFASLMSEISRFGLVTAVAALGVKSNLGDLMSLGPRPIAVLTLQTAALAVFGLLALGLIVGPMLG